MYFFDLIQLLNLGILMVYFLLVCLPQIGWISQKPRLTKATHKANRLTRDLVGAVHVSSSDQSHLVVSLFLQVDPRLMNLVELILLCFTVSPCLPCLPCSGEDETLDVPTSKMLCSGWKFPSTSWIQRKPGYLGIAADWSSFI